jgi:hypothetical protein
MIENAAEAIGIFKQSVRCAPIVQPKAIAQSALNVLSDRNGRMTEEVALAALVEALIGGAIGVGKEEILPQRGHLNPSRSVSIAPNLMSLRFKKLCLILSQT